MEIDDDLNMDTALEIIQICQDGIMRNAIQRQREIVLTQQDNDEEGLAIMLEYLERDDAKKRRTITKYQNWISTKMEGFQNLPEVTAFDRRKKEDLGIKLKRYRDIMTEEQRNYLDSYNLRLLRKIMPYEMDEKMMEAEILNLGKKSKNKNKKKYRKSKQ